LSPREKLSTNRAFPHVMIWDCHLYPDFTDLAANESHFNDHSCCNYDFTEFGAENSYI